MNLFEVLVAAHQYLVANGRFDDVLHVQETLYGSWSADVAATLERFAALFRKQNRQTDAEVMADRARLIRNALQNTVSIQDISPTP